MGKHTPGPWEIRRSQSGYPYQIRAPHIQDAPGAIIDVTRWGSISMPSSEEGEANARLISATPDLLEALRNCLSLVELKFGNTDQTGNAAIEQAKAALAKATGKDQ